MKILKNLFIAIFLLVGLLAISLLVLMMGESYETINSANEMNNPRIEIKKVFGIKVSEAEINSDGFYHGKCTTWSLFNQGNIKSEGQYKNGFWHGKWKFYDKKGNLQMVREYERGRLMKLFVPENGILQEVPKKKWPEHVNLKQDNPMKAKKD